MKSSRHEARISGPDNYTLIIRIDRDGEEAVIHGYKGRHFTTPERARRSVRAYCAQNEITLNETTDQGTP